MILALYLLKSTLAMSLLLVFYRLFLEKEKMHVFNRFYLLFAIVFSIFLPLLPTGIAFSTYEIEPAIDAVSSTEIIMSQSLSNNTEETLFNPINLGILAYLGIFIFFCLRFGRNIFSLMNKVKDSEIKNYKGARLVLLEDCNSPFTFWNYIFLQKNAYEKNNVDQQLLDHELTHAQQRHSWDILFIEFVTLIFWFNPILRWYKTAIQLNHEFLADDSVIEKYKEVKTYQYLLLDTIENNNKIYLASNINFHLTQKRLKMMTKKTKKSSSARKKVLVFSMLPILLLLLIGFGNPNTLQGQSDQKSEDVEGDFMSAKDRYFENTVVHYNTEDGMTKVITYKSLDNDVKAKIPLPPPRPPSPFGASQEESEVEALPKGTVVFLGNDGSVKIGNDHNGSLIPPPPPKAPKALKAPKANKNASNGNLPFPPKPPMPPKPVKPVKGPKGVKPIHPPSAPIPPEPPTPLPSFDDLAEDGAEFFIDGKKASIKNARKLWENNGDDLKCIDLKSEDNGKVSVHMTKK